ncbi:MAG TPA: radical SAM protein [Methylomirabilota bacterium]|nr:radical SAM protein [Methylomirabilota bacterium]
MPFRHLTALWVQVTGTWCNLACAHCINASGPREPWLAPMPGEDVRRWIEEAVALGVKEIYFTGGEPLLHREIVPLVEFALERAPTTVLTNGTLVDEPMADRLAALAARARYTLEIRVSLDHPEPERNDAIRGRGAFARALAAVRRLDARGLLPILTATETPAAGDGLYDRLRALLLAAGIGKPRVKILPLFPAGRMDGHGGGGVSAEMLDADAAGRLQCSEARAVAAGGVYACPILAGLPEARMPGATLAEALVANRLPHPACGVCWQTGSSCRNA